MSAPLLYSENYYGSSPFREVKITDFTLGVGFGYGESKLVSESVLQYAADMNGLKFTSIRVGQLSGGVNGAWSTKEWLPALVKSGRESGCLPCFTEAISWIPLHIAAQALIEMRESSHQYLHLVHPRPVPWSEIFQHISAALGNIPLVGPDVWIQKVEDLGLDQSTQHVLQLLKLYRGRGGDRESPLVDIEKAMLVSKTLASDKIHILSKEDVNQWIRYWGSKKFL